MYAEGKGEGQIGKILGIRPRLVSSIKEYEGQCQGRTLAPSDTLGYEEWCEIIKYGKNCVFVPIKAPIPQEPCMVSDFTTESETHSFIGGGNFISHNCGIAKNLALTCYLSIERDETLIRQILDEAKYISDTPTETNQTILLLNGMLRGWCAGEDLRNFCLTQRRTGKFYKDTGIVLAVDLRY